MAFAYSWTPDRVIPTSAAEVSVLDYHAMPANLVGSITVSNLGLISFSVAATGNYYIQANDGEYQETARVLIDGVHTNAPDITVFNRLWPDEPQFEQSETLDSEIYNLINNTQSNTRAQLNSLYLVRGSAVSLNVKDYGAMGDGVTDDSAAINVALTAAGGNAVRFPNGTYMAHGLTMGGTNSRIYSDEGAVIQNNSASSDLLTVSGAFSTVRGITFSGGSSSGRGVVVSAANVVLDSITVKSCSADSVSANAAADNLALRNSRIEGSITSTDTDHITISGNTIVPSTVSPYRTGFTAQTSAGTTYGAKIINNHFEVNGNYYGLTILGNGGTPPAKYVVSNNTFLATGTCYGGILISSAGDGSLVSNSWRVQSGFPSVAAINVSSSNEVTISGNDLDGGGVMNSLINMSNSSDNLVANNTISNPAAASTQALVSISAATSGAHSDRNAISGNKFIVNNGPSYAVSLSTASNATSASVDSTLIDGNSISGSQYSGGIQLNAPSVTRTNLAQNPNFEGAGTAATLRTNLATNPSFETPGVTFTVRNNLATNPRLGGGSTTNWGSQWAGGGSMAATNAAVADSSLGGYGWKKTWTTGGTSSGDVGNWYSVPITAGNTYSFSMAIKSNLALSVELDVQWLNGSGAVVGSRIFGSQTTLTANGSPVRVSIANLTAPSGAVSAQIIAGPYAGGTVFSVNDWLMTGQVLAEQASVVMPYFDGSTAAGNDYTYVWSGTADASVSWQQAMSYSGGGGLSGTLCASFQSTQWSNSRGKSVRIVPLSSSTDTFAEITGMFSGYTFLANTTYTLSAVRHVSAPLTGASGTLARANIGSELAITTIQAPPSNGSGRMVVQFTTGVTVTQNFIRLYSGAPFGGGDVWFDDIVLEQGALTAANATYFDGNVPAIRTNLALDPNATATTNWVGMGAGATSTSVDSTTFYAGTTSIKGTCTATGGGVIGLAAKASSTGFSTGDTIVWSMWVNPSITISAQPYWERETGAYIAGNGGANINCPANTWTQVSGTYTFTSGQANPGDTFHFGFLAGSVPQGTTVNVDAAMVERNVVSGGTFFDGTTAAASGLAYAWTGAANASTSYQYNSDFTYAWSGTADASTSVQKAPPPSWWNNRWYGGNGGNGYWYQASGGLSGKMLRKVWTSATTAAANDSGFNTPNIAVTPGQTLTGSVYMRPSISTSLACYIQWFNSSLATISTTSIVGNSAPANTWTRGFITASAPASAAYAAVIFGPYNGPIASTTPSGTTLDFDYALIELSSSLGTYFDGSTTGGYGATYAWSGTANASTSTQTIVGSIANTAIVGNVIGTAQYGFNLNNDVATSLGGNRCLNVGTRFTVSGAGGKNLSLQSNDWQVAAAQPTTDYHFAGEQVANANPAGSPSGWVCTVSGSPGTWQTVQNYNNAVTTPQIGAANGVAPLDATSKVPMANLKQGAGGVDVLDGSGKVPNANLYINTANGIAPLDATSKVPVANLNTGASGVAPLDSGAKVPIANLPTAANGVAPLDGSAQVPMANLKTNVANGVAQLDASAKVPMASLYQGANGVDVLDGTGKVPMANLKTNTASGVPQLDASAKVPNSSLYYNVANGVAPLDATGLVPAANLPASTADYGYVYAGFSTPSSTGAGAVFERMSIMSSADGHSFQGGNVNPIYGDPNTGTSFRDPSIVKIGSTYFCAYTVNSGSSKNFGIIKSTDLLNWTSLSGVANTPTLVDVSAATSINQCVSPELIVDNSGNVFAFWTNVTAGNANSIWYTQFTDNTGLTTWNAPAAITWAVAPTNPYHATMAYDSSAATYRIFYATAGYVQRASASTPTGTWTTDKTADWASWKANSAANTNFEAPEIMKVGSTWRIYMDRYVGTGSPYTYPGLVYSESSDLTTWSTPVACATDPGFPATQVMRHGGFIHLTTQTDRNIVDAAIGARTPNRHAEYTAGTSAASTVMHQYAAPALDTSNSFRSADFISSTSAGVASTTSASITIGVDGIYSIDFMTVFNGGCGGGWAAIKGASQSPNWASHDLVASAAAWTVSVSNVHLTAGQVVNFYMNTTNSVTSTPRFRIHKLG